MTDSTKMRIDNGCRRCEIWEGRDLSVGEELAYLDRDLCQGVKRISAGLEGDCLSLALRCLMEMAGWIGAMSSRFGYAADRYGEFFRICEDLLKRVERGPGLKVPGSHASPAKARWSWVQDAPRRHTSREACRRWLRPPLMPLSGISP